MPRQRVPLPPERSRARSDLRWHVELNTYSCCIAKKSKADAVLAFVGRGRDGHKGPAFTGILSQDFHGPVGNDRAFFCDFPGAYACVEAM
jgi:hypothetical protein